MPKIIKLVLIFILIFLGNSASKAQGHEFGVQIGALRGLDASANPVGITGNYYYTPDSNYAFNASIGYFRYCTKPNTSILSNYGHTIVPITLGARYYFNKSGLRLFAGTELGIVNNSNNIMNSSYEWGMFKKPRNSPFCIMPFIGLICTMNERVDFDPAPKYLAVSIGGCLVLNAGIKFPI